MTGRMSFGSTIDKVFIKMMPSTTPIAVHATVHATRRTTPGCGGVGLG